MEALVKKSNDLLSIVTYWPSLEHWFFKLFGIMEMIKNSWKDILSKV